MPTELASFDSITDAASAAPTLRKLMNETSKTGFFGHTHVQQVLFVPSGETEWFGSTRFKIPEN